MKFQEEIYADFFQFFVKDEQTNLAAISGDLWVEPHYADRLAVAPGLIAVRTESADYIAVAVELEPFAPPDDFDAWDYVAEASLEISLERLVVTGYARDVPTTLFINLRPGPYRVRIYATGLDANSIDSRVGTDHYRLVIWSANYAPPQILKRHD